MKDKNDREIEVGQFLRHENTGVVYRVISFRDYRMFVTPVNSSSRYYFVSENSKFFTILSEEESLWEVLKTK
jgi:hypothetical protein